MNHEILSEILALIFDLFCKYCMNIDFLYPTISVFIYQKYNKTEIIHVRNKNIYNMRSRYWISPDPNKTTITQ